MSAHLDTSAPTEPTPALAAFLVGRDAEGHWLAVETHGLGGGIFRDQRAALHYAVAETDHRPGAVRLCEEHLALVMQG